MDISNIQIGFTSIISLFSALTTGLSVFFALKTKISILENDNKILKKEDETLHQRISTLKEDTTSKSDRLLNQIQSFKDDLHRMELKILKAITEHKP